MPSGEQSRKNKVMLEIEGGLDQFQIKSAKKLYDILNKIEWFTTTPCYFGVLAIVAIPYLADLKNFKFLLAENRINVIYTVIFTVFLYIAGTFLLKFLIFNPLRKKKIAELKEMLKKSATHRYLLKTLENIDPDMARNIKNCLNREGIEF